MQALVSIIAVYALMSAILPALVALRRDLGWRTAAMVCAFGLLTGWTGYGAFVAWGYAIWETPDDGAALKTEIFIL
jgi:hypothetical protein